MASFKYIFEVLTEEEVNAIGAHNLSKFESYIESKQMNINNLRTQIEIEKSNAEQLKYSHGKELSNINTQLSFEKDLNDSLRKQLKETEAGLQKSRNEYCIVLQNKEQLAIELENAKVKCERQAQDKLDLNDLLERRMNEVSQLQEEIRVLNIQLQHANEGKLEIILKGEEIEKKNLELQYQEIRMQQERELFQKQIDALNEELSQKIRQLALIRRERDVQLYDIQSNFDKKSEELNRCKDEILILKQNVEKKDKHIESLADRIREIQQQSCQLENNYKNEIAAQNSLLELHKKTNADLKASNEKHFKTIEEMQLLLRAGKKANEDLEQALQENKIKYKEEIAKWQEQISELKKELKRAQENAEIQSYVNLEKEVEKYYPNATTTNKIIQNNLNFSNVYTEYIRLQKELEQEKLESSQLRAQLDLVAKEANENGPLLVRKIQEHQKDLLSMSELQTQLNSLLTEREQLLQDKDNLIRINTQFQREIKRQEQDNSILALQVRRLIQSVQEAKGFAVSYEQEDEISSSDNLASNVLSSKILTFKDIEDLQTKNQMLLRKVNEQQEQIKQFEQGLNESNDKIINDCLMEIEKLKNERRQQNEMFEALIQEREMLKSYGHDVIQTLPRTFSSTPKTSRTNLEDVSEFKNSLEKMNNEFSRFRQESDCKIRELSQENEKYRKDLANSKIEITKVTSELNFNQEKLQLYKTNMEQYQRENAVLKENNIKISEKLKNSEQQIISLRQDVLSSQDTIKRLEILNNSLKNERDFARTNEAKFKQERDSLIHEKEDRSKFMTSWQSFQDNLEKFESDKMANLKLQIDRLEKESRHFKLSYEKEQKLHGETNSILEKVKKETQDKLDSEIEKLKKLQNELSAIHSKVHLSPVNIVHTEISCLNEDVNKMRSQYEANANELKNMTNELRNLMDKLIVKNNELEQVKNVKIALEEKNNALEQTNKQIKVLAKKYKTLYSEKCKEVQISQVDKEIVETSKMVIDQPSEEVLNETREEIKKDYEKKLAEANGKIEELQENLTKLNNDLTLAEKEKEEAQNRATENEEKAKRIASNAKQKLIISNNEKTILTKEKEELSKRITNLEQNAEETRLRLATIKSQYDSRVEKLCKELLDAKKEVENFKQQLNQQQISIQTPVIAVTTPVQTSTPTTVITPVRHSVHPQQQSSTKSTPTASIKPLAIGNSSVTHPLRTSRAQIRTATIATVQPTTDDTVTHSSVPQATVQPTQTTPALVVVPPTPTSQDERETISQDESVGENVATNLVIDEEMINVEVEQRESEEPTSEVIEPSTSSQLIPSTSSQLVPSTSSQLIPSTSTKRTRNDSDDSDSATNPKKVCNVNEESQKDSELKQEDQVIIHGSELEHSHEQEVSESNKSEEIEEKEEDDEDDVEEDDDDDDVIVLGSEDSDDEQIQSEEHDEEEEDEEEYENDGFDEDENVEDESNYDEQEFKESAEESNDNIENENENENEEEIEREIQVESEDEQAEEDDFVEQEVREDINVEEDNETSELDAIGLENQEEQLEMQDDQSQQMARVPEQSSSVLESSLPSSSSQPFIQVPTPIQRRDVPRQSLYITHSQNYDEGDGIVPSTPTLFVPRRGDVFSEALNSPRVPQGRFVFSSTVPEATPGLSQLGSEGTLGVDDTRMDLSQFDDNNGRSVPTTPLASSPAVEDNQNLEILESNDSVASDNLPSTSSVTEVINFAESLDEQVSQEEPFQSSVDLTIEETEPTDQQKEQTDEEVKITEEVKSEDDVSSKKDDPIIEPQQSDLVPSTSTVVRTQQTAKRGRGFRQRLIQSGQRNPINWPSGSSLPVQIQQQQPVQQQQQSQLDQANSQGQPSTQQLQQNRRIQLNQSRFSRRPSRPPRGGPFRGSPRGGYQN